MSLAAQRRSCDPEYLLLQNPSTEKLWDMIKKLDHRRRCELFAFRLMFSPIETDSDIHVIRPKTVNLKPVMVMSIGRIELGLGSWRLLSLSLCC